VSKARACPALNPGRLTANDDYYFDIIKNGKPGTVMPASGPIGMTDEEIWALVGLMRSEPAAEAVQWELDQIAARIETSGPGLFIRSHHDSPYVWADTLFGDPPNCIYVFDPETFEVVQVVEDGVQTLHPQFTNDGKFVYVSDWQGNAVRVYDAATFELVAETSKKWEDCIHLESVVYCNERSD
jgi:outer membrane protein assembly factor BamB